MVKSFGREVKAMGDSEVRKAWLKENVRYFSLKLMRSTDADIIERLEEQESIQGYIKELIRKDIKRSTKKSGK